MRRRRRRWRTCSSPKLGGHLYVLRWARDDDCLWDPSTCSGAGALVVGTCVCCSGCGSTGVRGKRIRARTRWGREPGDAVVGVGPRWNAPETLRALLSRR